MKQFAQLYQTLDESNSTNHKIQTLVDYYLHANSADAAWATYFLAGGKPKRLVPSKTLREVAYECSGYSRWLFDECYQTVGDLAETIALIIPFGDGQKRSHDSELLTNNMAYWMQQVILPLRQKTEAEQAVVLKHWFMCLPPMVRFVLIKIIAGGFRVGVSRLLLTKALAKAFEVNANVLATRLIGYCDVNNQPSEDQFNRLVAPVDQNQIDLSVGCPLPFYLASPLTVNPEALGSPNHFLIEWKYDGIRAQIIQHADQVFIWSRGEELLIEQFPELTEAFALLPENTVLDGEILVWQQERPADFKTLQTRIKRKKISNAIKQSYQVVFMAYDCLRLSGQCFVRKPLIERRQALERLYTSYQDQAQKQDIERFRLSELVVADSWKQYANLREKSRSLAVEGFMLKPKQGTYGVGRARSESSWLKWKVDPMTIDCVLVYAQRGHGKRASLYTDYTFAVWSKAPENQLQANAIAEKIALGAKEEQLHEQGLPALLPFTKAYSGLSNEEIKRVDKEIRKHTLEKFGPVRTVKPTLVLEVGFEAIAPSKRHKSGYAVRFPRILRIRDDKTLDQANTLNDLAGMLPT